MGKHTSLGLAKRDDPIYSGGLAMSFNRPSIKSTDAKANSEEGPAVKVVEKSDGQKLTATSSQGGRWKSSKLSQKVGKRLLKFWVT